MESPYHISTYSRPAYKHKYETWRTIALYALGAWLLTSVALVRAIAVNSEMQQRLVTMDVEVAK